MSDIDIYYSPYLYKGKVCVICWQWFDCYDYNEDNFFYGDDKEIIAFKEEKEAKQWVVNNVRPEFFDTGESFLCPEMTLKQPKN